MTPRQKLLFYGTTIPLGVACGIIFPHNSILAMGFSVALVGAASFLWAYRGSLFFWLGLLVLAACHIAILLYLKNGLFPEMQRGTALWAIFTVALTDGVAIYCVLLLWMTCLRIMPAKDAQTR